MITRAVPGPLPGGVTPSADVIIVGTGPAGSVAGLVLARRGVNVLLLDRAAFPRPKPCGDCLSAAATDLLDRLGVLGRVHDAGAIGIDHWRIVAPNGAAAVGRFSDRPALALERRLLDQTLLDAALEAGARFERAHVTDLVMGDGRVRGVRARTHAAGEDVTFGARLVVGADGLRSIVARRLDRVRRRPRLRKASLTAHLAAPRGGFYHGEVHLVEDGCVGFAPAGTGLCNITVVVDSGGLSALGELGPAEFFRRRVERIPAIVDRLPGGSDALTRLRDGEPLASGPFDWPSRGPVAHGAALVGDAAGYYDPFTGQGTYHAMAGAHRLAEAVAPVLALSGLASDADLDRALAGYAGSKRRLTRPARRVQRVVEEVLSREWLADRVLGRLARAPAAMDRLVEVTGDLRAPASLLSAPVVSSLLFPPATRRFD